MQSIDDFDYRDSTVLLRVDINSPIDQKTKRITNENRIKLSVPTIEKILKQGARLAIIAHQGDTLDYQNLIPLAEHAEKLSGYLGIEVAYIDDVCGPAAQDRIKSLKPGEAVLLGNLRYLCEEISTFENAVTLKPEDMLDTYLLRSLAPLIDYYVNDAFAAAHRNAPSMVAFQEIKPTAAGDLLFKEVSSLTRVMTAPKTPCVFVLGGAKISDAFGMMKRVLASGSADKILTCGVTGEIMLLASGYSLGTTKETFIKDHSLDAFIADARSCLEDYPDRMLVPVDLAYADSNERKEVDVQDLPLDAMFMDIGSKTAEAYARLVNEAGTVFANGPPGAYEDPLFELGTRSICQAIAETGAYTVIGGGDTVTAAAKYVDDADIDYICTAGGAMVRFLSGKKLPLIEAMEN